MFINYIIWFDDSITIKRKPVQVYLSWILHLLCKHSTSDKIERLLYFIFFKYAHIWKYNSIPKSLTYAHIWSASFSTKVIVLESFYEVV